MSSPASMAGLLRWGKLVSVGPPLSARAPSSGSVLLCDEGSVRPQLPLAGPAKLVPASELASNRGAGGGEMKRARFSEEQIIGILKEAETAGNVCAVCREHNITEQTFYRWRNKYGGMDVSEARKLRGDMTRSWGTGV